MRSATSREGTLCEGDLPLVPRLYLLQKPIFFDDRSRLTPLAIA